MAIIKAPELLSVKGNYFRLCDSLLMTHTASKNIQIVSIYCLNPLN